jgi:shikimate kinase
MKLNMPGEADKTKHRRLAFIGMSGSGKTFWSRKLAAAGWKTVSCDDTIERRLAPRLAAGGYAGINGVAAWMGWPDSATYAEREAEYLAEEIAVVDEFLTELEKQDPSESLVLDTTGSVIYAQNNILMRLRRQMTVVHLASSEEEQQILVRRYLNDPKPVLWRGAFHVKDRESSLETVARCYPMLIELRRKSYETLAHCSVKVSELRAAGAGRAREGSAGVETFLEKIRQQLE